MKNKYIFLMPAITRLTGGPGAVAEYIKELQKLGHQVEIYIPSPIWHGVTEFSWNKRLLPKFNIRKSRSRSLLQIFIRLVLLTLFSRKRRIILKIALNSCVWMFLNFRNWKEFGRAIKKAAGTILPYFDMPKIPKDSIVVATFWPSAFASALSDADLAVYLMQHYEEVFYPDDFEWSLLRMLARTTYDLPLILSSNSQWLTNKIKEIHGKEVNITHTNGIPEEFSKISSRFRSDKHQTKTLRVIAYARPEPWKGMATVIRAIQILREHRDVQLLFYGQIDDYWKSIAKELNFDYMENFTYASLIKEIQLSDIVLCGSWYESFPLPPLEGIFAGTPVVCTQLGTEEYAIHNQSALIYRAGDHKHAAELIDRLMEDPMLGVKLSEEAIKVARKLTWETAHSVRTTWLTEINSKNRPCPTNIPLRLVSSIKPPYEYAEYNSHRVIRDKFGHIFLLHKGVARHLHSDQQVRNAKRKYKAEIEDFSLDEMLDLWRV